MCNACKYGICLRNSGQIGHISSSGHQKLLTVKFSAILKVQQKGFFPLDLPISYILCNSCLLSGIFFQEFKIEMHLHFTYTGETLRCLLWRTEISTSAIFLSLCLLAAQVLSHDTNLVKHREGQLSKHTKLSFFPSEN